MSELMKLKMEGTHNVLNIEYIWPINVNRALNQGPEVMDKDMRNH